MKKLSNTQLDVLVRLKNHGGEIIREKGGFWTWPESPRGPWKEGWPDWSVGIRTVRALEGEGYLERTFTFPEEWRDTRKLTAKAVEQ